MELAAFAIRVPKRCDWERRSSVSAVTSAVQRFVAPPVPVIGAIARLPDHRLSQFAERFALLRIDHVCDDKKTVFLKAADVL